MTRLSQKFILNLTRECEVTTQDNLKIMLHFPEDYGYARLYFYKNYETGTTNLLKEILKKDDTVMDIGANIGWFTVLLSKIVSDGKCHSFEPNPRVFNKLKYNCSINNLESNVVLNKTAVGGRNEKITLYVFEGLPHGGTSTSMLGRSDYRQVESRMITLDDYYKKSNCSKVDLIKCDVEGAELGVLEGAKHILSLEEPPMWILEMNKKTAKAFGYSPSDLLKYLTEYNDYKFYKIEKSWGKVLPMKTIHDYEHGDNVLCIIPGLHRNRNFSA